MNPLQSSEISSVLFHVEPPNEITCEILPNLQDLLRILK